MKPPICELCGNDFRAETPLPGGLVQFADYRPLPDGMTGHPEGLAWFCGDHIEQAKALTDLTRREALKQMTNPGQTLKSLFRRWKGE